MNPDDMISGGLPDDFDGTITRVRLTAWDYDGNIDSHVLAVAMDIEPAEDSDLDAFTQYYSAGRLEDFVPSMDGEEASDLDSEDEEDWEGLIAIKVGRKDQLNNNTNWAHFLRALVEAGFDGSEIGSSVDFLEGLTAHFNRIPQKKRAGIITATDDDGKPRSSDILVVSEILESAPAKKKGKKGKKGAAKKGGKKGGKKKEGVEAEDDDLDERIVEVLVAAIDANDGELPKSKIPGAIFKGGFTGKDKRAAVKRAVEPDFLEGQEDSFIFDADDGALYGA